MSTTFSTPDLNGHVAALSLQGMLTPVARIQLHWANWCDEPWFKMCNLLSREPQPGKRRSKAPLKEQSVDAAFLTFESP